nr:hypothetical protein [uncultured Dongia sp.]
MVAGNSRLVDRHGLRDLSDRGARDRNCRWSEWFLKGAEAGEIALSSRCRPIDMRRDSLYYLTAVHIITADHDRRHTSAIASQRSAGSSIQRKKGFDNVFARRRDMNNGRMNRGRMNSSWPALVRLHPAA